MFIYAVAAAFLATVALAWRAARLGKRHLAQFRIAAVILGLVGGVQCVLRFLDRHQKGLPFDLWQVLPAIAYVAGFVTLRATRGASSKGSDADDES
jgi:hypothetical protein